MHASFVGYGLFWPGSDLQSTARLLIAALAFIVGRDALRSSKGDSQRHVLCPVVDLINYRSGAKSELSYEYFSGRPIPCNDSVTAFIPLSHVTSVALLNIVQITLQLKLQMTMRPSRSSTSTLDRKTTIACSNTMAL